MPAADNLPASVPFEEIEQGTSLWRDAARRFLKNRMAVFGLAFVGRNMTRT
jgi:hypothetical protein